MSKWQRADITPGLCDRAFLMVNREMDIKVIQEMTSFSRSQIFDLRRKYLEKGISSIEDPARHNPKELLSKKDRDEIINPE